MIRTSHYLFWHLYCSVCTLVCTSLGSLCHIFIYIFYCTGDEGSYVSSVDDASTLTIETAVQAREQVNNLMEK